MSSFYKAVLGQFQKLALLPDYFRAIAKQWLNIIFGETLVGIAFLLWWALTNPSNSRLILVFVVAMFTAGYYAWRAEHVRLAKKIEITRVSLQAWTIPQGSVGAGHSARAYYFEVVNGSEGATVEGVSVQLKSISPEVSNLNWLPVHLHLKHDNRVKAEDYVQSFNLNPREPRNVDFVSALEGDNRFSIIHVVPGVNSSVPFDTDGHRLQVMVTAKDMSALLVWFKVWRNEAGLLECEMEK